MRAAFAPETVVAPLLGCLMSSAVEIRIQKVEMEFAQAGYRKSANENMSGQALEKEGV